MHNHQGTYYTIQDYAKTFNYGISTIRKWITQGKLEASKQGSRWRILVTPDNTPKIATDDALLNLKDEQILMLKNQVEYLQTTLQQTIANQAGETDKFQRIVQSQNLLLEARKPGLLSKLRSVLNPNNQESL